MRTTLDLADDVLLAAKELARRQKRTAGEVISELARVGLRGRASLTDENKVSEPASFYGFVPITGGVPVTNEFVNRLRDELGE